MTKSAASVGAVVILVNACIWGFTMIMAARTLSGTGAYKQIQHILGGGAGVSLVVVGGGIAALMAQVKTRSGTKGQ